MNPRDNPIHAVIIIIIIKNTKLQKAKLHTSGAFGVSGSPSLALRSCTWSVRSWFDRCRLVFLSARNLQQTVLSTSKQIFKRLALLEKSKRFTVPGEGYWIGT